MKKRILTLALALMMCVSLLPVTALATEEEELATSGEAGPESTWSFENGVFTISGTGYMWENDFSWLMPWAHLRNQVERIVIDDGITTICRSGFSDFDALTEVVFPDSIEVIGYGAFDDCDALTSVTIPATVQDVCSFGACKSLTAIEVDDQNPSYCDVDGVLFNKDMTELLCYPAGKAGDSYVIPESVTLIGYNAFADSRLKSVSIPNGVTSIGDGAFAYCEALESIDIPDSVTSLGESETFTECRFTSFTVPDGITYIGVDLFAGCSMLTEIHLPASLEYIDAGAFEYCYRLFDVYFDGTPEEWNAVEINNEEDYFFGDRENDELLKATVHFNDGTIYEPPVVPDGGEVSEQTGSGELGENITWTLANGTLTISGEGAMYDYETADSPLYDLDGVQTVVIEDGITRIGDYVFYYLDIASVTIPESVTSIGEYAFYSCGKLAAVELPKNLKSIGNCAFEACNRVRSVLIPASVEEIGYAAFAGCLVLSEITVDEGNQNYCSINGVLFDKDMGVLHQYPLGKTDKSYEIPDGVSWIGHYAFMGDFIEPSPLVSVTIPEGVTYIGYGAFLNCDSLESITIPSTVTSMNGEVFLGCDALTSITLPEGLTSIEYGTFFMTNITSIDIPSTVEYIDSMAFYDCDKLTSVTLHEGLTEIKPYAFYSCDVLASIDIPESVTTIGSLAFIDCDALTSVVIPERVTTIGEQAFYDCDALFSVQIPASVTTIHAEAFDECNVLDRIYYTGSSEMWDAIEIAESNEKLNTASILFGYTMPAVEFSDVGVDAWYRDTVVAAATAGIIAGNSDGTFAPNDTLSWAQTVTFAVRLAQYNAGELVYGAADQTGTNWYDVYVTYALENGIITAVATDPNADILRGDAAVIFAAVLGTVEQVNEVADGYFTDVEPGSGAQEAIYLLAQAGIANGKGGGEFGVNDTFLRCEVATIVARMAGLVEPARLEG